MRIHALTLAAALVVITVSHLPSAVESTTYPVGITNCGVQSWINAPPQRAVTLNQGTTEVMLGLGLADRMAGTAYLDDEIWPEVADDYNSIPVLSDTYPDIDTLMGVNPDFLYGSYKSAFQASMDGGGDGRTHYFDIVEGGSCNLTIYDESRDTNRTYCRPEIQNVGIETYLQTPYCELAEHQPAEVTLDVLYQEIYDIAMIFDAMPQARILVDNIENHFKAATKIVELSNSDKPKILWLDGWDPVSPFVGSCCGSVQAIIDYAGATNIYEDLGIEDKKSWADGDWGDIAEADPDVIVMIDAGWDMADQKIYELCKNETTRNLRAVQNRNFITVPFSASTLGVRIGTLAYNLAEAFVAFSTGKPLSSVDFSTVSITMDGDEGGQAIGSSGARVYTRLPIWNGTDLETFCPGGMELNVAISDAQPDYFSDTVTLTKEIQTIPGWGIALIVIFVLAAVVAIGFIVHMIRAEKKGKPLFAVDEHSIA